MCVLKLMDAVHILQRPVMGSGSQDLKPLGEEKNKHVKSPSGGEPLTFHVNGGRRDIAETVGLTEEESE